MGKYDSSFPQYDPTVVDIQTISIEINDEQLFLETFDVAGQEGYESMRQITYPGSDVIIICMAVDSDSSYSNVRENWLKEVPASVPIILVGTKCDLRGSDREEFSSYKGEILAKTINARTYIECSAKSHEGLTELFEEAIQAAFPDLFTSKVDQSCDKYVYNPKYLLEKCLKA